MLLRLSLSLIHIFRGGGRKPWRQKGTGHARQGSIRAPQWTHGGIALGPKPRDYSYSLNRKVKRLAIKSAFSTKALEENIIVVDNIDCLLYTSITVSHRTCPKTGEGA